MKISLLVAASENNCIGAGGTLPWHLPNDLKMFRNLTWGMPVIMGRNTYESLGKPLKGRVNIVVSSKNDYRAEGIELASGLDEAIAIAGKLGCKEVFVIGGGKVYAQLLPMADTIFLTRVHAEIEGDTFFPALEKDKWTLDTSLDFSADDKHAYAYSFQCWKRK